MEPERLKVFREYASRFDNNAETMPIHFRFGHVGKAAKFQNADEKHAAIRYINLCSEEFFLAECGYVDPGIWKHWAANIIESFSNKDLWNIWKEQYGFYSNHDSFCKFIEAISGMTKPKPPHPPEPNPSEIGDLDTYLSFTRRFDEISKSLPLPLRMSKPMLFKDVDGKDKDIAEIDKQNQMTAILANQTLASAVLRYINLCSEEYYLSLIHI